MRTFFHAQNATENFGNRHELILCTTTIILTIYPPWPGLLTVEWKDQKPIKKTKMSLAGRVDYRLKIIGLKHNL